MPPTASASLTEAQVVGQQCRLVRFTPRRTNLNPATHRFNSVRGGGGGNAGAI